VEVVFLPDHIRWRFCLLTLWVVEFCVCFLLSFVLFDRNAFTQRLDLGFGHFLVSSVLLWLSLKRLSFSLTRSMLFHRFSFDTRLPVVLAAVFWSVRRFLMVSPLVPVRRVVGTCWGSLLSFWRVWTTPCFFKPLVVVVVGRLWRLLGCWGLRGRWDACAAYGGDWSSSDVGNDCLVLLIIVYVCVYSLVSMWFTVYLCNTQIFTGLICWLGS